MSTEIKKVSDAQGLQITALTAHRDAELGAYVDAATSDYNGVKSAHETAMSNTDADRATDLVNHNSAVAASTAAMDTRIAFLQNNIDAAATDSYGELAGLVNDKNSEINVNILDMESQFQAAQAALEADMGSLADVQASFDAYFGNTAYRS